MSVFTPHKNQIALIIALVLLFIGAVQLFIPAENTREPIDTIVEWANKEISETRNSLWAVWGITRLVNAGISLLQEKEIGLVVFSGQPFKVFEPLDDTIERMSNVLFYLAMFSTVLSFVFEPMVIFGFIIGGTGSLGIWMRGSFDRFGSLTWPNHLAFIGGYLLIFPILFFVIMQLFQLATNHRIESAHKRFNSLTQTKEMSLTETRSSDSVNSESHQNEDFQINEDQAITNNTENLNESGLENSETSNKNQSLEVPENDEGGWFDWVPGIGDEKKEGLEQLELDSESGSNTSEILKNSNNNSIKEVGVQENSEKTETIWFFSWIPDFNVIPDSVNYIADQAKTYFTDSIDLMQQMLAIVKNTEAIIKTGIELMALYLIKLVVFPVIIIIGSFLLFRVVYKRNVHPVTKNIKASVENIMAKD